MVTPPRFLGSVTVANNDPGRAITLGEGMTQVSIEPLWEVAPGSRPAKRAPPTSICMVTLTDPLSGQEAPVVLEALKTNKVLVLRTTADALKADARTLRFVLHPVALPPEGSRLPRLIAYAATALALVAIVASVSFALWVKANAPQPARFVADATVECPVAPEKASEVTLPFEDFQAITNALGSKKGDAAAAICKSNLREALGTSIDCPKAAP